MTKKLETLFNLDDESEKKPEVPSHKKVRDVESSYNAINEITQSLPQIAELNNLDDAELDDLASKAEQAYDDLMDLGMNVEVRYSGRIFEVASSMMKNAIDAKTAKIDKKLKK